MDQEKIDAFNLKKAEDAELAKRDAQHLEVIDSLKRLSRANLASTRLNLEQRRRHEPKVEVKNLEKGLATNSTLEKVSENVDALIVSQFLGNSELNNNLIYNFEHLINLFETAFTNDKNFKGKFKDGKVGFAWKYSVPILQEIDKSLKDLLKGIDTTAATNTQKVTQRADKNAQDLISHMRSVESAISKIKLDPKIDVRQPDVKVSIPKVDLTPIANEIASLKEALKGIINTKPKVETNIDLSAVVEASKKVERAIKSLSFPVPNYVLPFRDSTGKAVQVNIDNNGTLPTTTQTYATQVDPSNGTYTYVGKALPGSSTASAIWQIRKIDNSSGTTTAITYAGGSSSFTNIWDNRSSLTYS